MVAFAGTADALQRASVSASCFVKKSHKAQQKSQNETSKQHKHQVHCMFARIIALEALDVRLVLTIFSFFRQPSTVPAANPSPAANANTNSNVAAANAQSDEAESAVQKDTTKCWKCQKKVGLTAIKCRCGFYFCGLHRYSDKHECGFNYRELGLAQLSKANPLITGSKIEKI